MDICGTDGGTCSANWAGMMVTQPAVTSVGGARPLLQNPAINGLAAGSFTGSNSELHLNGTNALPNGDAPISMVAVIYPGATFEMTVLALGDYALPAETVSLRAYAGSAVFGMYGGDQTTSVPVMSTGQWYVVAGTYGGPSNPVWKAYVDGGNTVSAAETAAPPYIDIIRLSMGMFVDLTSAPFAGYISEAMVYNTELTEEQVQGLSSFLRFEHGI